MKSKNSIFSALLIYFHRAICISNCSYWSFLSGKIRDSVILRLLHTNDRWHDKCKFTTTNDHRCKKRLKFYTCKFVMLVACLLDLKNSTFWFRATSHPVNVSIYIIHTNNYTILSFIISYVYNSKQISINSCIIIIYRPYIPFTVHRIIPNL